jgi:hypothetical protein
LPSSLKLHVLRRHYGKGLYMRNSGRQQQQPHGMLQATYLSRRPMFHRHVQDVELKRRNGRKSNGKKGFAINVESQAILQYAAQIRKLPAITRILTRHLSGLNIREKRIPSETTSACTG